MGLDFRLIDSRITRQVTLSNQQYITKWKPSIRHFFVGFRETTKRAKGVHRKAGGSCEVSKQNVKSENYTKVISQLRDTRAVKRGGKNVGF